MQAHAPLWIDSKGRLCDAPPESGIKLAAARGAEIPPRAVNMYDLDYQDGKVIQRGHDTRTPEQQERLVADRDLFVSAEGILQDTPAAQGIKLCSAGEKIANTYVQRYGLYEEDGEIRQKKGGVKQEKTPENKKRSGVQNKGGGFSTPTASGRQTSSR